MVKLNIENCCYKSQKIIQYKEIYNYIKKLIDNLFNTKTHYCITKY